MYRPIIRPALPILALALVLGAAPSARAADAARVADDIVAAITAHDDVEVDYADATADGDEVTITGLSVTRPESSVEIDTIVVTDPVPRDAGGFTAERMRVEGGRAVDEEGTVTWESARIEEATVPAPEEADEPFSVIPARRILLTGLVVEPVELADPIDIAGVDVRMDNFIDTTPQDIAVDIDRMTLSSAALANRPEQQAFLESLGYTSLVVDVTVDVGFDDAEEAVSIRHVTLGADQVGRLDLSGRVAGVPFDQLQDGADLQTLLEGPMVERIEVRFDNDGVVERLIDMQAQQQDLDADAFRERFASDLGTMLSMIGNPAFEEQVAGAAAAFLREPRTLRVAATPATPVAVMQLVALAMAAPQTLPDMLGVEVTANE